MKSPVLPTLTLCASLSLCTSTSLSQSIDPIIVESLIAEGDVRFDLNITVASWSNLDVATDGSFIFQARQGTSSVSRENFDRLAGSTTGAGPITLLFNDTSNVGTFETDGFFTPTVNAAGQFGFTAIDDIEFTTNDTTAIVVGNTLLAIEGQPEPAGGSNFNNLFLRGLDNTGRVVFESSGTTATPGDEVSKLYRDSTVLFQSGDAIGNTTENLRDDDAFDRVDISSFGTHILATVFTDNPARNNAGGLNDNILTLNGDALLTNSGGLVREGDLIGTGSGGLNANERFAGFQNIAVNEAGDYAVGGFTNAASPEDAIVFSNGAVVVREGDSVPTLDGGTFTVASTASTLMPGVALNDDGDLLIAFADTLILNGVALFTPGDSLDNGDNATANPSFFRVFDDIGLSNRDANGDITVYFAGRPNLSNSETLYRFVINPDQVAAVIPEPTGLALLLALSPFVARLRPRRAVADPRG